MKKELRFVKGKELRVKSDDGKRTLTGYAATFNTRSDDLGGFREVLAPGAFTRSIKQGDDVVATSDHDPKKGILGRTGSGTLRLSEDNVGLRFELDLPNTTLGNDIAESVNRGDLDSCSFGFVARDASWDHSGKETLRTVRDASLFDVSVVTYPAYPGTSVQLRSLMFPDGLPEFRAEEKEKTVDGEVLHASDFLIVGNADDPETWKLPVHFSTEEKTKSHIRNALARFDQLEGVSDAEKTEAHAKLVKLAQEHGIDVDDKRSLDEIETDDLLAQLLDFQLACALKDAA